MASITVMKHTTGAACNGQIRHVYRTNENYGNPEIQKDRENLNIYIGNADQSRQAIHATIQELDAKIPPKRVKQDRKTVAEVCIPAPREGIPDTDAILFFQDVLKNLKENYHVVGAAIHADEVHEYIDPHDKQLHTSRVHMHVLIVPETEKGCNMKAWLTKSRFNEFNSVCDKVCERQFGYAFHDGSQKKSRGSVEQMKAASAIEAARQLPALEAQQRSLEEQVVISTRIAEKASEEADKAVQEATDRIVAAKKSLKEHFPVEHDFSQIVQERSFKTGIIKTEDVLIVKNPEAVMAALDNATAVVLENQQFARQIESEKKEKKRLQNKAEKLNEENRELNQNLRDARPYELIGMVHSGLIQEAYVARRSIGLGTPGEDELTQTEAKRILPEFKKIRILEVYYKIVDRIKNTPELRKQFEDLIPELKPERNQDRGRGRSR